MDSPRTEPVVWHEESIPSVMLYEPAWKDGKWPDSIEVERWERNQRGERRIKETKVYRLANDC